ncbi:hypothetical protein ABW636_15080 [Aquimarina sp. 2201CG1-2-11]|uniref:hypothetical protein n=1 Tax=Aquimarina discodermiae TaxID=3231043 RepID=UPI0034627E22
MKKVVRNLMLLALVMGVTFACGDDDLRKIDAEDVDEYLESLNPTTDVEEEEEEEEEEETPEPEALSFNVTEKSGHVSSCDIENSTWSITGEFTGDASFVDDIENAQLLASFEDLTVDVEVKNLKEDTLIEELNKDSFTNDGGKVSVTFDITFGDVLTALELTSGDISTSDKFKFELVFNAGDVVYNNENLLDDSEGSLVSFEETVVEIISDTKFVGDYTVSFADPDGLDGGTFTGGLAFADDVTYTLVVDPENEGRRIMKIVHQPKFCSDDDPIDFIMDFTCDAIIVPLQSASCHCGDGTDWHGPAVTPTNYDVNDDSTFVVKFEENANDNCTSYAFHEAEVTFTKVE